MWFRIADSGDPSPELAMGAIAQNLERLSNSREEENDPSACLSQAGERRISKIKKPGCETVNRISGHISQWLTQVSRKL
jgi:hypothetical protein